MGIAYCYGIPFIKISGNIRQVAPLDSYFIYSSDETRGITGLSTADIVKLAKGSNTWNTIYEKGYNENNPLRTTYGNFYTKGELIEYNVTGCWNTEDGQYITKSNGNILLHTVNTHTNFIKYNDGTVLQYMEVGLVDSQHQISFAVLECSPNESVSEGAKLSTSASSTIYGDVEDIYTLLEYEEWTEDPEPKEGGRFGLENRFSPRIASNSFGMYVMNSSELQGIMRGLWTKSFSEWISQKIGLVTDPSQMLLGCKWYYGIRNDIMLYESKEVPIMGNLPIQSALPSSETQSDIPMNFLRKEFCTHDCGSITVPTHFNNYLDYQSKYQLYLPFLGFIELNPSDIIGGTINVRYNINMATGYAMIIITANNDRTNNKDVEILTLPCECGITVPLTFTDINSLCNNIIQSIGKSVIAGITAGTGVGLATKAGLSAMSVAKYNDDYGEWSSAVSNTAINIRKIQGAGIAGGLATAFNGGIPSVGRSGDLTSEGGTVGSLKPFLLITRPVKITPTNLHDIYGKRSVAIKSLRDCSGYTKVSAVKPGSLPTNNKYIDQIVSTLQAGVYL